MNLPTDPKGEAGKAKPQLQLIPPVLNTETAKALAHGNAKYGPWNWRASSVEMMTYLGAIKRHVDAVLNREDLDPESGADHLGHVAASCGIVLDARENGTLIDNRPWRKVLGPIEIRPQTLAELYPRMMTVADLKGPGHFGSMCAPTHEQISANFARPVDGMTLTTVMSRIQAGSVFTTGQLTTIEQALTPLFEPYGMDGK